MTASQALHLIEQFASQAPFAIWIADSHGTAVFANQKVHELFRIAQKPSGALGINLFDTPEIESLGLQVVRDRAKSGELVDEVMELPVGPSNGPDISGRETIFVRVVAYPLLSSAQSIEHYVLIISDVTHSQERRRKLTSQVHEIEVYNKTRKTRQQKEEDLIEEARSLEEEIRSLGGTP